MSDSVTTITSRASGDAKNNECKDNTDIGIYKLSSNTWVNLIVSERERGSFSGAIWARGDRGMVTGLLAVEIM